ncbi:MAG TPA: PmoA family protein [Candidatus Lokiarchaeia archaeon]|nr:PmoA family protein [Candidatus Lokiarchaeia archaeon]
MDLHIVVLSGAHDRYYCPINKILDKNYGLDGVIRFKNDETGSVYPADAWTTDDKTEIGMIMPYLHESQELELSLDEGPSWRDSVTEQPPVSITKKDENTIDIKINNEQLTVLHVNDGLRPYLYPFIGPHGDPITRHFPMKTGVIGETNDHPHHQSVWTAYGDVNEVDHWSAGDMAGTQVTNDIPIASSGAAIGRIVLANEWKNKFGDVDLEERREMRVFNLPRGCQTIDFQVALTAISDDVKFGDTKEGGLLAVRVATSMDGDKGGRIENAYGAVGEKGCWGKQAPWVDYSGIVKGNRAGFAMFDHPSNFRHPTYWHVRDYGLFAANPFGLKAFTNGRLNGDYILAKGATMTFTYRLIAHAGDARSANILQKYLDFIDPPEIKEI